jgi:hypothetical protein
MDLHIRPRGDATEVCATLRDDGWALVTQTGGALLASHPDVPDEAAARHRLQRLGLLTSGALQIEFRPRGDGFRTRPSRP